jgi:hypothetical protein
VHSIVIKAVAAGLLIGGASLAGRRWGHRVGGWMVGLPLTSGPVAFFLATDHGPAFAARASVGMLAGTISQIAFALAYRATSRHAWPGPFAAATVAFAATTLGLSYLRWPPLPTFTLVAAALTAAYVLTRQGHRPRDATVPAAAPPRWDIPVRMVTATAVVLSITALAPRIGAHLSGLLSPFPVFGAVLGIFTHHIHGSAAARAVLDGLITGLAAPAVFFLALALALPHLGLTAFAIATVAALLTQTATMFAIPTANKQPADSTQKAQR